MKHTIFLFLLTLSAVVPAATLTLEQLGLPQEPLPAGVDARIIVTTNAALRPIKPLNGVIGAVGNRESHVARYWRALKIPYARNHDVNDFIDFGNPWMIDVTRIFRDFDADETDLKNYRFDETDRVLNRIGEAGTKTVYRLGPPNETRLSKQVETLPPKDFAKYARICERIVARYKGIERWEIWNEPDRAIWWGGTREEFVRLYVMVAKHLKAKFQKIRIGGPAVSAGGEDWADSFLADVAREKAPLDFFSWYAYDTAATGVVARCRAMRTMLDRHGFKETESVVAGWNYLRGWDEPDIEYSHKVHGGVHVTKGASFLAETLTRCQDESVDQMFLRDAVKDSLWNPFFDSVTEEPLPGYYVYYAWRKLAQLGEQIPVAVAAEKTEGLVAVAARGKDGRRGLLVTRCPVTGNDRYPKRILLELPGGALGDRPLPDEVVAHLTDRARNFTEVPLERDPKGRYALILKPDSFAYVEW